MLAKFWESLGENLAEEWLKYVFSPALMFWAGGLLMYILNNSWQASWKWLNGLQLVEQVALLITALLVLVLSSLIIQRLRFDMLRFLEGYWHWPLRWLADKLSDLKYRQFKRHEQHWNELKNREETLTRREAQKLAELERCTHYFPISPKDVLPTVLGNILSSAETTPAHKYGLDAFVCWPRLWLLLPEHVREDLRTARNNLMILVEIWVWGLLFFVWIIWSNWAIPIAILWLWLSYALILRAAMAYADLLEATFDLYRWSLYQSAHWHLPEYAGDVEIATGQRLTEFFWRGVTEPLVQYQIQGEK